MLIPISTDTSIRRTPWVNYALIGMNVAIFVVPALLGGSPRRPSAIGATIQQWLAEGMLDGTRPQVYQFFTYQFLHANWVHILGNMLFLWVFGNPVNAKMGHWPYLMFYLAGGIFAAAMYGFYNDHSLVGASGSIAAVTAAYLALFPRSHITILYWFIIIGTFELPSLWMIVFKLILWDNVLAGHLMPESNVAFSAHLAGYSFGFLATCAMLWLRTLPRDQFDIVALWRRWMQRQGMRSVLSDSDAQARAQFGRVARPVSLDQVHAAPAGAGERNDQIGDLRFRISDALAHNDRDAAAELYEKVMELDPRQVLPRQQQLDVANQLYTLSRLPQAAAAYEKYLNTYSPSPEADQVRLLLGIIYARDLQQYEIAEGHLVQVAGRFSDSKREEQCQHWLNVVTTALHRPRRES